MDLNNNLVIIILCGIPCSGKSTWAQKSTSSLFRHYNGAPIVIISRDEIREELFGKNYKFSVENEKKVTNQFYRDLARASNIPNAVIILDNTHCRNRYINETIYIFRELCDKKKAEVYIRFFDISLIRAYWRNFWRKRKTGKTVPNSVIRSMYKNYKRIDKTKYKNFIMNWL